MNSNNRMIGFTKDKGTIGNLGVGLMYLSIADVVQAQFTGTYAAQLVVDQQKTQPDDLYKAVDLLTFIAGMYLMQAGQYINNYFIKVNKHL